MEDGERKTGDFMIEGDGVVLGPKDGTATISNATITNKADNGRRGDVSDSKGSALISKDFVICQLEGVTIDSNRK